MRRLSSRLLLILLGIYPLALAAEPAGEKQPHQAKLLARLRSGLSKEEVLKLLGPPRRIARQILYHRHLEQWTYEKPLAVQLEFDCPRGREALGATVYPLRPTKK